MRAEGVEVGAMTRRPKDTFYLDAWVGLFSPNLVKDPTLKMVQILVLRQLLGPELHQKH
jgi:hypothetical protein